MATRRSVARTRRRAVLLVAAAVTAAASTLPPPVLAGPADARALPAPERRRTGPPADVTPEGNFQPADHRRPAFRPTMDPAAYAAAKGAAARAPQRSRPGPPTATAAATGPPVVKGRNYAGVGQGTAGNLIPPDTHGADGISQFLEVTNTHLDVYDESKPPTLLKSVSLNSFFRYTGPEATTLFDPRAVYDHQYDRFLVSAVGFAENDDEQYLFLGISKKSKATGGFYIYKILVNDDRHRFFDFPMLGYDDNAVIVTSNFFGLPNGLGTPYFFKKADVYNGLGTTYSSFSGLSDDTLAPPIVQASDTFTYLVSAPPVGTAVDTWAFSNTGGDPQVAATGTIDVPDYALPRNAKQPGTTTKLDSSDSRFVNASTQVGTSLYQVHTIDDAGFPTPRWYQFDMATNTVVQSGFFSRSSSSDDWNASIAANAQGDVFVTWSSTDTNVKPEVRISGRQPTDPVGVIPSGSSVFTSPAVYAEGNLNERWGDYSAVSLNPEADGTCGPGRRAWIVNETVASTNVWGTRIARIGFC